ncbi:MAG: SsrA-binding protein SmpB [Patescibacteria group bacterium]|nr:SsrA-binding protein SmpB [Patescibacteria group bacterium]
MSTLAINKRATFDYETLEKFTAGIELTGHETKSMKLGHPNIVGAHAIIRDNEVFSVNIDIPSFQPLNAPSNYDPLRTRKLLLRRSEIKYLAGKLLSGLTLVPLKLYTDHGLVKVEIALARGRKKHDKRELIKKRESDREIRKFKK